MLKPQKQTWDTRAWLLGILSGSVGGSLTAWFTYPPIQKHFNHLPGSSWMGNHLADIISGAAGIVTLLVLPGLLSGFARRWTFFWGALPLCLFIVSVEVEDWIENGIQHFAKDWWWISLAITGCCWVISSGPVSLIRWLRVRAVRRHQALQASYAAMREAASAPQEGVWPPPPDYRG